MSLLPSAESFQENFCSQYGVPLEAYHTTVLRLTLYPHARWLADLGPPGFLASDRTFVAAVGKLTRWRDFSGVARDFQSAAENRRFWRRRLRLRVSVARMRALFSDVMRGRSTERFYESRPESGAASEPGSFATD